MLRLCPHAEKKAKPRVWNRSSLSLSSLIIASPHQTGHPYSTPDSCQTWAMPAPSATTRLIPRSSAENLPPPWKVVWWNTQRDTLSQDLMRAVNGSRLCPFSRLSQPLHRPCEPQLSRLRLFKFQECGHRGVLDLSATTPVPQRHNMARTTTVDQHR
ncbi:MAG: hypothetical protein J3Q66DRAFT_90965 [Benniella sp.]|nr:MAG: hypothetical protein J3Q66DRAFT_90965 [Benniella sp.]